MSNSWIGDDYRRHPVTMGMLKLIAAKKQDALQSFMRIEGDGAVAAEVARRQGFIDALSWVTMAMEKACKDADKENEDG